MSRRHLIIMRSAIAVVLLALAAAGKAQTSASYSFFGNNCTLGSPLFNNLTLPQVGTALQIQTQSSWNQTIYDTGDVFLVTGFSNQMWGSTPLPFDTSVLSGGIITFCGHVYTSGELVQHMPVMPQVVPVVVDFPIPNQRSLIGAQFHQQVIRWGRIRWGYTSWHLTRGGTARIGM